MNDGMRPVQDDDVIFTLRTVHQNQVQLNQMADQKANILVGLIVIPLTLLSTQIAEIELNNMQLSIVAVFILFEIAALILGIMVIRPRTMWSKNTLRIEEMPNPLFFGFFTRFTEEQYLTYMQANMNRNMAAREFLLRDIYQIGHVLKRKFQLLKVAYFFATSGFVFAVLAFVFYLASNG